MPEPNLSWSANRQGPQIFRIRKSSGPPVVRPRQTREMYPGPVASITGAMFEREYIAPRPIL
jgi:hypothetical protein